MACVALGAFLMVSPLLGAGVSIFSSSPARTRILSRASESLIQESFCRKDRIWNQVGDSEIGGLGRWNL